MKSRRSTARVGAMCAAVSLLLLATGCASGPDGGQSPSPVPATNSEDVRSVLSPPPQVTVASRTPMASSSAEATVNCDYTRAGSPARPVDMPSMNNVPAHGQAVMTLEMAEGNVTLTMDRAAAPCTVNSFQSLATQGFYNDTKCHRLVDQGIFVLQCGDPTGTGRGGPGYRFADELTGKETYPAGTVAMANAGPNTNGSQFFLVWSDSKLSPDYTVFGKLDDESLKVVQSIAAKGVSRENAPNPISPAQIKQVSAG